MKTMNKDVKDIIKDDALLRIGISKVAYKLYDFKMNRLLGKNVKMDYDEADQKARLETMKILIDGVVDEDAKIVFSRGVGIYGKD